MTRWTSKMMRMARIGALGMGVVGCGWQEEGRKYQQPPPLSLSHQPTVNAGFPVSVSAQELRDADCSFDEPCLPDIDALSEIPEVPQHPLEEMREQDEGDACGD